MIARAPVGADAYMTYRVLYHAACISEGRGTIPLPEALECVNAVMALLKAWTDEEVMQEVSRQLLRIAGAEKDGELVPHDGMTEAEAVALAAEIESAWPGVVAFHEDRCTVLAASRSDGQYLKRFSSQKEWEEHWRPSIIGGGSSPDTTTRSTIPQGGPSIGR